MKDTVKSLLNKRKQEKNKEEVLFIDSILDCDMMDEEEVIGKDLMHDDVIHPERQYGSCSHAQIQDGRP